MSAELESRIAELENLLNDEFERANEAEKELSEANSREDDLTDMNDTLRTEVENLKEIMQKMVDLTDRVL